MKSSVSLFMALVTFSTVQELSKLLLPLKRDQKVILEMKYANMIQVASWDKNQVLYKLKSTSIMVN